MPAYDLNASSQSANVVNSTRVSAQTDITEEGPNKKILETPLIGTPAVFEKYEAKKARTKTEHEANVQEMLQ